MGHRKALFLALFFNDSQNKKNERAYPNFIFQLLVNIEKIEGGYGLRIVPFEFARDVTTWQNLETLL